MVLVKVQGKGSGRVTHPLPYERRSNTTQCMGLALTNPKPPMYRATAYC